jgi:flagellar motor switch/type III secretory pathway protein FliN
VSKRLGYNSDSNAFDLEAFFDVKINRCWNWFHQQTVSNIQSIIKECFSVETEVFLFAVNAADCIDCERILYFVTQKEIRPGCNLTIKFSKIAVDTLLENAFGKAALERTDSRKFALTEIEASVLSSVSDSLIDVFEENLTCGEDESAHSEKANKDTVNLIYMLKFPHCEDIGRIDVSIPSAILAKPQELLSPEEKLDFFAYRGLFTEVNVVAGKSKTTFEELKNLEVEDFVILEKSNSRYMTMKTPKEIKFAVDTRDLETIDINNSSGGSEQMNDDENILDMNIWDNLQLEITAEFKRVKMPLGELKQITEGLVIDVAPIVQNEILLHVEGKKIASGELVVIGDRFGVKVTKIYKENAKQEDFVAGLKKKSAAKASLKDELDEFKTGSESDSVDDDFDYSAFEIEDEL